MIGPIKFEDIRPGQTIRRTYRHPKNNGYEISVLGLVKEVAKNYILVKGYGTLTDGDSVSWQLNKDVPKPPSKGVKDEERG